MADHQAFDIAIIGAGPGGYVAAIKAAQCGKSVALIEKSFLGGSCLNCGCIPTKTLLANAEVLHNIKRSKDFGISVGNISIDYGAMKRRKDNVIKNIQASLEGLLKANKITIFGGVASFISRNELKIKGEKTDVIQADKFIIATGSNPLELSAFPTDGKHVLNSTSILELTEVPKSLAIVGGGYIGCEFASLFAEMGSKVTIIEALPMIVAAQGERISSTLTKSFEKRGIEILTNASLEKLSTDHDESTLTLSNGKQLKAQKVLIAVGRSLATDELDLQKIGLSTTKRGAIEVNDQMETNVKGVYAIGDITGKAMLAHVASHQGIVAAANIVGQSARMHYHAIPAVIFTYPEIAMVGLNEKEAKEMGYDVSVNIFPFQHHGKAIATMEQEGYAAMIVEKTTHQILGAEVIGHGAANLIGEMAIAVQNELTTECVEETIHAHPTMIEGWLEAALLANDSPIHFPPKRRT